MAEKPVVVHIGENSPEKIAYDLIVQHGPEIKAGAEPGAVGAAARVVGGIAVRKARLHPSGTNGGRPRGRPFYATQSGLFPRTLRATEEDTEA
jgi:hypothetical protein